VLGDWLASIEARPDSVRELFEDTLAQLIVDNFDVAKADRIFEEDNNSSIGLWDCFVIINNKTTQTGYPI
jgi:hypothetical protein